MHCSEAENLSRVLAIGPIVGQSASDGGQGRYEPTHLPPIPHSYQTTQPAHRVQGISSTQFQVISVQPQSSSSNYNLGGIDQWGSACGPSRPHGRRPGGVDEERR